MIRLSEILSESTVRLDMPSRSKDAAIVSLVESLAHAGVVTDTSQMVSDIQDRERVMTTGIGGGIAVPHAQSTGATRLAMALGRTAQPIEFESIDERPVQLIFLVVGPEDRSGFIRVLARISRLCYSGDLLRNLLLARTPAEVMDLVRFEETRITG